MTATTLDRPRISTRTAEGMPQIDALTGVRIVAAAGVFLNHSQAPESIQGPARTFLSAGYNGVTLFFVLSGFVLAWNYADRLARPTRRGVWSFFVARFARIYPLYLFGLLWAVAPAFFQGGIGSDIWLHVFAVQAWAPDIHQAFGYNSPAWSVSVEAFLYACFPLLIVPLAGARRRPRVLIGVMAACVAALVALAWWFTATGRVDPWFETGNAHHWLYRMPVTRLGDFIVGICLALLVHQARVRRWIGSAAQIVGVTAIVGLMLTPGLTITAWSWDVVYMVPMALLIWGLATAPRSLLGRFLGSPPLVLLGQASFAFYLLHKSLIPRLGFAGVDTWQGWVVALVLQFVIIALVSIGAHYAIERPAQRWLRRTLDRDDSQPARVGGRGQDGARSRGNE